MLKTAVCPQGNVFTVNDLPRAGWGRWSPHRKQILITAVEVGMISLPEVLARYAISAEEFASWRRLAHKHGVKGLRTQRLQEYRHVGR